MDSHHGRPYLERPQQSIITTVFSRIIAVIINRLFGLPLVNYFDDLGSMIPTSLSDTGLRLLQAVCALFGVILEDRKADIGRQIVFLGLLGHFPGPDTDMILSITLSDEKMTDWIAIVRNVLSAGRISHKDLKSLTGKISFSQTPIFGRFGRVVVQPLYRKQYAAYYQPLLSDHGRIALSWWVGALSKQDRRAASRHKAFSDVIIYTDAATSTMIMASIVIFRLDFLVSQRIAHCRGIRASADWVHLFSESSLIYGLELTALVLTVADPRIPLNNLCITCYVDNDNTLSALIKADCFRTVIAVSTRLFWAICSVRGMTPWLERVGSPVNISDIPARGAESPFETDSVSDLSFEKELLEMAKEGIKAQSGGYFDPELLVGRLYSHVYARTGGTRS